MNHFELVTGNSVSVIPSARFRAYLRQAVDTNASRTAPPNMLLILWVESLDITGDGALRVS